MASFLKDRSVMEEGHRVDDLLDFSSESSRLESYINDISHSSIIGYIGKFGSGKSTCIYQLIKTTKLQNGLSLMPGNILRDVTYGKDLCLILLTS